MSAMEFKADSFRLFAEQWALVTAGDADDFNTMTIAWGGLGTLWRKPVATVYIRPDRYTYGYMNRSERFTVSFFSAEYRDDLQLLGSLSGRDGDKIAKTKLTPKPLGDGVMGFAEAQKTLVCRKICWQDMDPSHMTDTFALQLYQTAPVHRMFIGEVEQIL